MNLEFKDIIEITPHNISTLSTIQKEQLKIAIKASYGYSIDFNSNFLEIFKHEFEVIFSLNKNGDFQCINYIYVYNINDDSIALYDLISFNQDPAYVFYHNTLDTAPAGRSSEFFEPNEPESDGSIQLASDLNEASQHFNKYITCK